MKKFGLKGEGKGGSKVGWCGQMKFLPTPRWSKRWARSALGQRVKPREREREREGV